MALNIINFRKQTKTARLNVSTVFARNAAKAKFLNAKKTLIRKFDSSDITQEILGKQGASNISNTLGGRANLFGFIGFPAESNPINPLRNLLIEKTTMEEVPIIRENNFFVSFSFSIKVPSKEDLEIVTPLVWEPGSWLTGIEQGISGLTRYIYWKLNNPKSRSKLGLQATKDLRPTEFSPKPYVTNFINEFLQQFPL